MQLSLGRRVLMNEIEMHQFVQVLSVIEEATNYFSQSEIPTIENALNILG